jgi:hypothetical protein
MRGRPRNAIKALNALNELNRELIVFESEAAES